MNKFLLFSGTSNPALAQKISAKLNIKPGGMEIDRFIDNECRIWVKEKVDKYDQVFVLQSLSQIADQNLVELCLIGQALKSLKARHITAIIPWLGYSKQDKEFRKGEAVSAQLVARFIEAAGFDQIITLELHSENLVPFFNIPVKEISTQELLAKSVKNYAHNLVVSPDSGGQSRSEKFARNLGLEIVYADKKRNLTSGQVEIIRISTAVKNRDVIIFDDIINTGETAVKLSRFLKTKGAQKITFLATHAVMAGNATELLKASPIHEIVVTDTIFIPKGKQFTKLKIVSVADLISVEIRNMLK